MKLKKRLLKAFFCFWLLTNLQPALGDAVCESSTFDTLSTVSQVIDGDTIITQDNTHVRLLGIDTPEFNHDTGTHEWGAAEARQFLSQRLKDADHIGLVFDEQVRDQYDRTLAHVFLPNGTNIQSELLRSGHAVPYTFPPNLKFTDCYFSMAQLAKIGRRGVWSQPNFQRINVNDLKPNDSGFRIISGKITDYFKSERSLIIELNQTLRVFILTNNLKYFSGLKLDKLVGKTIEVYGKIHYRDKVFWVQLRHPYDLKIEQNM